MGYIKAWQVEDGSREHWCTCVQDEMLSVGGRKKEVAMRPRCYFPQKVLHSVSPPRQKELQPGCN